MKKIKLLSTQIITILILTFVEGHWAMGEFGYEYPSYFPDEYPLDLFYLGIIAVILIFLFLRVFCSLKVNNNWQIILSTTLLVFLWYFMNYLIFFNQISSFLYNNSEPIWISVKRMSIIPILVCGNLYYGISYLQMLFSKKNNWKNEKNG